VFVIFKREIKKVFMALYSKGMIRVWPDICTGGFACRKGDFKTLLENYDIFKKIMQQKDLAGEV